MQPSHLKIYFNKLLKSKIIYKLSLLIQCYVIFRTPSFTKSKIKRVQCMERI